MNKLSIFLRCLTSILSMPVCTAGPVLSEIMVKPFYYADAGEHYASNEYIELYNAAGKTIDLSGWRIENETAENALIPAAGNASLLPGHFAVIFPGSYNGFYDDSMASAPVQPLLLTIDASRFLRYGLKDQSGTVNLIDPEGITQSSFSWDTETPRGFSWANRQPGSSCWEPCKTATPGFANPVWSIAADYKQPNIQLVSATCTVHPFSENVPALIRIQVKAGDYVTAQIFTLDGLPVQTLMEATAEKNSLMTLQWYGINDQGRLLNTGIYLIHVRAGNLAPFTGSLFLVHHQ